MHKHILKAFEEDDNEALETWDIIQEDLRCCGDGSSGSVHGYQCTSVVGMSVIERLYLFFSDWRKAAGNLSLDLRESCCVKVNGKSSHKCDWRNFFKDTESRLLNSNSRKDDIDAEIYRTGCLTVLDSIYQDEVRIRE